MTIEILYFDGCPNHEAILPQVREIAASAGIDIELDLRRVADLDAAVRERFLGSPTVRLDGEDVEPGASERTDFGMRCRLYHAPEGLRGTPPDAWIRDAIDRAARDRVAR